MFGRHQAIVGEFPLRFPENLRAFREVGRQTSRQVRADLRACPLGPTGPRNLMKIT
jgi:hypothetical protein